MTKDELLNQLNEICGSNYWINHFFMKSSGEIDTLYYWLEGKANKVIETSNAQNYLKIYDEFASMDSNAVNLMMKYFHTPVDKRHSLEERVERLEHRMDMINFEEHVEQRYEMQNDGETKLTAYSHLVPTMGENEIGKEQGSGKLGNSFVNGMLTGLLIAIAAVIAAIMIYVH